MPCSDLVKIQVGVRFKDEGQVQGYKDLFKVYVKDSVTAFTTCISSGMVSDSFYNSKHPLNGLKTCEK